MQDRLGALLALPATIAVLVVQFLLQVTSTAHTAGGDFVQDNYIAGLSKSRQLVKEMPFYTKIMLRLTAVQTHRH